MYTTTKRALLTVTTALAVALPLGLTVTETGSAASADGSLSLPQRSQGQQAIGLLGDRLDDAAVLNGMSAKQLRTILATDPTAWLDTQSRMFYIDPAAPAAPTSQPAAAPTPEEAPYPLNQTFLLHSQPASDLTIFLDFDGTNVSGTAWNTQFPLANGDHPAWTLDGDPTTFNDPERELIQSVWQRVAEDYAPFNVDVTTQDPGAAALVRTSAGDTEYGSRALISPSTSAHAALCSSSCGGIAYINVFGTTTGGTYQPAWIFPQALSNDAKNIAEAASHEVGHNLSLNHDGTTVGQGSPCSGATVYYCGHAMWAPIMGVGYYRPVVQWSKGEYANANNTGQDDLALIKARIPLVADEAGGTVGTAASSLPTGPALITSRADQDMYSLGSCAGALTLSASPAPNSPNLDIQLSLVNSGGGIVASADPAAGTVDEDVASGLGASLSTSVPAGTYYARIDGVGVANRLSTGYSDYASLGSYTLTRTGCSGATTVPPAPSVTGSTAVSGGVRVAFSPNGTGGSPITGYTAGCTSTNGGAAKTKAGTASPITVTGLTVGKRYHCRVRATNAVGTGPYSAYGATLVVTATAPAAPSVSTTRALAAGLRVAFVPGADGGSAVTGFSVQCVSTNGGATRSASGAASPVTVTGVTAGRSYHCRVRATNAVGTGPYSAYGATVTT